MRLTESSLTVVWEFSISIAAVVLFGMRKLILHGQCMLRNAKVFGEFVGGWIVFRGGVYAQTAVNRPRAAPTVVFGGNVEPSRHLPTYCRVMPRCFIC